MTGWSGLPTAMLTEEAFDTLLGFAKSYAASVTPCPPKKWWAAFGNYTLPGAKVYLVKGGSRTENPTRSVDAF